MWKSRLYLVAVMVVILSSVVGCGERPSRAPATDQDPDRFVAKEVSQEWNAPLGQVNSVTVSIGYEGPKDIPWGETVLSDEAGHTQKTATLDKVALAKCMALEWEQKPVISDNGSYVAIWSSDALGDTEVRVFETHTGNVCATLPFLQGRHDVVSFSPDSHGIYSDLAVTNLKKKQTVVLDHPEDFSNKEYGALPKVVAKVIWLGNNTVIVGGYVDSYESFDPARRPILAVYRFALGEKPKETDLSRKIGDKEYVVEAKVQGSTVRVKTWDGTTYKDDKEARKSYTIPIP